MLLCLYTYKVFNVYLVALKNVMYSSSKHSYRVPICTSSFRKVLSENCLMNIIEKKNKISILVICWTFLNCLFILYITWCLPVWRWSWFRPVAVHTDCSLSRFWVELLQSYSSWNINSEILNSTPRKLYARQNYKFYSLIWCLYAIYCALLCSFFWLTK